MSSQLDKTFRDDSNELHFGLWKTSYEVLYASTNTQLAGRQMVSILEIIEKVPDMDDRQKAKAQNQILTLAQDGLKFLSLNDASEEAKGKIFLPMIERHLKLFALLANPQTSAHLEELTKLMTQETPDITHVIMNHYRRLLFMSLA